MTLRSRFFAMTYDRQMAKVEKAGLRAYREGLLAGAAGRVLEIGAGTGIEPALLRPGGRVADPDRARDPDAAPPGAQGPVSRRREPRSCAHRRRTCRSRTPPFDVAVSTLVLCGVDDQPRALRELRRVLRPGGQLLFIEHVRSGDTRLARSQDRMNGINRFVVGCDCNRPTLDSIREAGLHRHARRAHDAAEGPQVRQPGHRGQRYGSCTGAVPGRPARRRNPVMTIAAARCRRFCARRQPGASPVAPGFSAWGSDDPGCPDGPAARP